MYINPEVYNYEALKPEHKRIVDGFDIAVEEATNKEYILPEMCGFYEKTILAQMQREIGESVIAEIEKLLAIKRLELIAGIMDGDESYQEE